MHKIYPFKISIYLVAMKFTYFLLFILLKSSILSLSYRIITNTRIHSSIKGYGSSILSLFGSKKQEISTNSIKSLLDNMTRALYPSKDKESNKLEIKKLLLLKQLESCQPNGINVPIDRRIQINQMVEDLELRNPTNKPAYSSKMNGFWRMLYTDFSPPSTSAGKLGPFIGKVYQDLDSNKNIIKNILELSFPPLVGALIAKQSILNEKTWSIEFDRVGNKLFNLINLPTTKFEPGSQIRLWEITYLDDDLRIMRARRPEIDNKESFLFILQRVVVSDDDDSKKLVIDI